MGLTTHPANPRPLRAAGAEHDTGAAAGGATPRWPRELGTAALGVKPRENFLPALRAAALGRQLFAPAA